MIYNNETMLPYDAFKKDPLGRIKLHGGGDSGPAPAKPYDVTKDKQYIEQMKFLDTLKGNMAKNNVQLTPEQIIAALTPSQRSVIGEQGMPSPVTDMSSWGKFNIAPKETNTTIIPQSAPQAYGSPFMGAGSINPNQLAQLQALLGQSNYLPSSGNVTSGNIGAK